MRFQRFARVVLMLIARLVLRLEVSGLERVPRTGRLIIMMNHLSWLDPILTTILIPRDIAIMSKIENFQIPVAGLLVKWFGSFPVRRGEADLSAVRQSVAVLEQDRALLMAPEGTRSRSRTLQQAHAGMALVATRANAPILPVALSGVEHFNHNIKRLRRTPVRVAIGEPFLMIPKPGQPPRAQHEQMTQEAMYRLAALLPPAYRGVYSDLSRATTEVTRPYVPSEQVS